MDDSEEEEIDHDFLPMSRGASAALDASADLGASAALRLGVPLLFREDTNPSVQASARSAPHVILAAAAAPLPLVPSRDISTSEPARAAAEPDPTASLCTVRPRKYARIESDMAERSPAPGNAPATSASQPATTLASSAARSTGLDL